MSKPYGYSVKSRETFGLDPAVYRVHIGVYRHDVKVLTRAELAMLEAQLSQVADLRDDPPLVAPAKRRARSPRATKSTKG